MLLVFALSAFLGLTEACKDHFDAACYRSDQVITRDVAIIGGGASGAYAAVQVHDTHSVVLVEKLCNLGGQVLTYVDPSTKTRIDYGVQSYWNNSVSFDFFSKLNVSVSTYTPGASTAVYADFSTGQTLPNFTFGRDLDPYEDLIGNYSYLLAGWEIPSPVPHDLTLAWSHFLKKYRLESLAYFIYSQAAVSGVINILNQTATQVLRAYNINNLARFTGPGVSTAAHDNSQIYTAAAAYLAGSVLLNSTVIAAHRPADNTGVRLVVCTPQGNQLILASRLIISIPQTAANMAPFSPDRRERALFARFRNDYYYTGLFRSAAFPTNTSFSNTGASTPYHIPIFPALYHIYPTRLPGLYSWWYGAQQETAAAAVQEAVCLAASRLVGTPGLDCTHEAFRSHSPFNLHVSAAEIQGGFYARLQGLQGYRGTWYTGLTWATSSGTLWKFTKELVGEVTATL